MLSAVAFLQRCANLIDPAPTDTAELAKIAVLVHELFLDPRALSEPDEKLAAAISEKLRAATQAA